MKKLIFLSFIILTFALNAFAQDNPDYNPNFIDVNPIVNPNFSPFVVTASWTTIAPSPNGLSRCFPGTVTVNDTSHIFQFGGGTPCNQVARYNVKTNTWSLTAINGAALPLLPVTMSAGTAIGVGDSVIFLFGGYTGTLGTTLKYNVFTNTFTTLATMPTAVTDAGCIRYHDSLVYVVGGGDGLFGTTTFSAVQIYNIKSNTYSTATALPMSLAMHGIGTYGDTIYTFAGWSAGTATANCYKGIINPTNPAVITWTALPSYPGTNITRMASFFVAKGTGGGICCTGGAVGGATYSNTAYLWDICSSTFITLPTLPTARSNMKGVSIKDSVGYVISGYNGAGIGNCDKISFTQIDGSCLVPPGPPVPTGTWTEQTSGITTSLYSVSAVNDNVAWACGASGKVLRTTNKGVAWTNVSGTIPTTVALYCIFAYDANTAIVTGVAGTTTSIYQTANGGTTWTLANSHAGFGDDLYMTDATTAYFIGDPIGGNWDLLKSTNAGLNWASWTTLATTNTAGTYNNAGWFQGTQVWFPNVGLSQMYYSSNMGANWVTQTITLSEITATCFNNATNGLAGGSTTSPGLLKTTNGGTTWAAITSPFTTSISGIAGASTSWWVSQQGLNIAFSSNDGTSWATQYTVTAGSFYHLTKSRSGATIWGVRSNGAISRYGQPIIGITPISNEVPSSYSLSQNYPNPFNPVTRISYALPKSGMVTLKVYDVLGKEVTTLISEVKNAGTYSVDFDASTYSSGIYFYKIETNGFTSVKKMMLVK